MSKLSSDIDAEIGSDQENDEFEDALDLPVEIQSTVSLEEALEEAQRAIQYFFNNQFVEARNLMRPRAQASIYHAVGNAVFSYMEAMLTFERDQITTAIDDLKLCLAVCNKNRKKTSMAQTLSKMVKRQDYDNFTELEVHAELCYAEALLLRAMLTFVEDETLTSFIRGGLKIRSCFALYKECKNILDNRTWGQNSTKVHIESGVCMGIGTFNLMISMLPSRVIKLLEMIGFSGDKNVGISNLEAGYYMQTGLRQILCVMALLGYHLVVLFILSHQDGDLKICEEILPTQLAKYPNGVWFLFFKGRLEFLKGNLDESVEWYKKSWKSQKVWVQFHHVCFWELIWVYCLKMEWDEASSYAGMLVEQSRWSRTIYSYQRAAIMLMKDNLAESEKLMIASLMRDVPRHKQRIAGKSLPMEKFAVRRAERYLDDNNALVLPAIELMYIWNLFKIIRKNFSVANSIYKLITKSLNHLEGNEDKIKYFYDNKALLLLLKGACLRHMQSPLQSLECLEKVIELQKNIKEDTFVVPYAIVEIALLAMEEGNNQKALYALEEARKKYTGYSLESRLHFRIHTAATALKETMATNNNHN